MPLTVETGTGAANSDTFISEADFVSFADKRGVTITQDQARPHLVKAMDWMLVLEADPGFVGERKLTTQALPFPRKDLLILNKVVGENEVPREAILAQCFAAVASYNGVDLLPVEQNGAQLIAKKTGEIEKRWAYDPNKPNTPLVPQAFAYVALMLVNSTVRYNQRA